MVQHVFGKPGLAVSSVHVTLYDQFSTGQTWWFITAIAYTIHIPVIEKAARLTGSIIQAVIGLTVRPVCPKHEGEEHRGLAG